VPVNEREGDTMKAIVTIAGKDYEGPITAVQRPNGGGVKFVDAKGKIVPLGGSGVSNGRPNK
jgi:hypothetical protein